LLIDHSLDGTSEAGLLAGRNGRTCLGLLRESNRNREYQQVAATESNVHPDLPNTKN
jgi:hypothetical protein